MAQTPGDLANPAAAMAARVVKPARRGVLLILVALVIEYLVVPELIGASKDLNLLGRLNAGWLAAGVVTEGLSACSATAC